MDSDSFEMKYNQLQDFLASIAHEIRTPLNGIVGLSDILASTEKDPVRAKQLKMMNGCGSRLSSLTNEIVDMAAYRNGKIKLNVSSDVQLNDLCDSVYEMISHSVDGRGRKLLKDTVKFEKVFASDLPVLQGDADRLIQVIYNIVSNAVKFTNTGFIRITTQFDGECVLFSCADSGKGIQQDHLKQIFDPFCQEEEGLGLGLGLAISSRILVLHGGSIWAESTMGKGSVFHVKFPLLIHFDDDSPNMYFAKNVRCNQSLNPIFANVKQLLTSVEALQEIDSSNTFQTDLASLTDELEKIRQKVVSMNAHVLRDETANQAKTPEASLQHESFMSTIIELESTRDNLIADNRTLIWRVSDLQNQINSKKYSH